MPCAVMSKNKTLLNFMYAISLPESVAAMLTPAMSYYGRYFYFSCQVVFFFLDHGLMAAVTVLCIVSGLFRPDAGKLGRVLTLFLSYTAVIYVLNKILDQNFLFLNYPDEGTILAVFAGYLGNPGYLLPTAALAFLIIFSLYCPWMIKDRKKRKS
jgi:uncharacterized membrane protein YwaF